jgi:hypothetical protein
MTETFNIIKQLNSPTKATLFEGTVVHRQEKVFVLEYKWFVKCAPYDNHFVFAVPKKIKGPAYQCSCGSMAHFIGSNDYAHLSSLEGMMLTCMAHTTTGKHADGSS